MSDNTRMPRIGEIWARKDNGAKVLILNASDEIVDIYTDKLKVTWVCPEWLIEYYKPVGEYDLDPLVLALRGDRT